ncbi:MAG: prepilin peptidase [Desulfuromonas sp.]|mgnify:CR=1 FL=1|nr:MAG: prepilin peptidase [Desulfuromonas sp.]
MSLYVKALLFAFVLGAVIGSFLNVCIYRIPAGESIVSPASRCPRCGQAIRWYQNIPILSFLLLRGKCGSCHVPISWRYPAIEALTGVLFALVLDQYGVSVATLAYWLFAASLVTIMFIDLDHQIIPDVISLPGILVGFCLSFFVPWVSWLGSLVGIVVGGGSLLLVAWGYELLTGREGMGGGDIKFLAMIGAFLGWKAVLPVVFMSSLLGSLVGIPLMLIKGGRGGFALPFGPFLASAALVWLLYADLVVATYWRFLG